MPNDAGPILRVPTFARLDDYFGVWAIEPSRARLLWDAARRMDLAVHVAQAQASPTPAAESGIIRVETGGTKQIAIIRAMGPLMKQRASLSPGTSTVQLRRDIRAAAGDPEISGILLAIDSPGGTVSGTHDLARDVQAARAKKPVWVQIEDLGASAAYWIASQAEKVFANSSTAMVGSIGTIMTVYDVSAMAEKDGIKAMVFATGALKGSGVPGTQITEDQQAYFTRIVEQSQVEFDQAVREGRGFSREQLAAVRSGEVFGATEALRLGLVDGVQSMDETMSQLIRAVTAKRTSATRAEGGSRMEETTATIPVAMPVADPVAEHRSRMAAELERQAAVQKICTGNGALAARAVGEGWDATRAELEMLRAERPNPTIISRSHDRDCTLDALQGALILRMGGRLDHPAYQDSRALAMGIPRWLRAGLNADARQQAMEWAHRFRDMSALDVCREAVRLDGRDCPHDRAGTIQAAFSGASLTNIFTANVNAILLTKYMEAGDTTQGWTREQEVADFKTNERPRLTKGSNLEMLPRGGKADHYTRSDTAESYKIARYAKQFQVDEQDIIDDALNALADMPSEMGMAAARLRPDLVYAILLRNAALVDSIALFHSSHSNLNTSAALASATLRAAIAALEKQREGGVNLNLRVTHLIVPSDLKHTAGELINSATLFAGGDTAVGVRGSENTIRSLESLTPVSDARLSNGVIDPVDGASQSGSTSTWYLASSMAHTIEVGYLRGTGRAPQVRTFVLDKGKWGMGWDVKMDIGAKAIDYHGLQKNTA